MDRLRIAVLGAGSVGCYLGGHLAEHAEVTLIGRPAVLDTLAGGLTLSGGERPARTVPADRFAVATTPQAAAGADFVLVTVKTAATAAAARQLAELGSSAVVVSLQNGLYNTERLRAALPGRTVLAAMVPYNVLQSAPGTFHRGTAGAVAIEQHPAAAPLLRVMTAAGLSAQSEADIGATQRSKLMANLNNAVNALSDLPLREQLGQRAYRRCLALCQGEALTAFRAAGLPLSKVGPFPAAVTARVLLAPDAVFRRIAAANLRVDDRARSSMWEDLERGRPTEVDNLQGEVVALAAEFGLKAPVNARLAALVHEAERGPRRRWSGPELLAELTAARG